LQNFLERIESGDLNATVTVVISSKAEVRGLEIAKRAGIPTFVIERGAFADDGTFSTAIYAAVSPFSPHLLICAGFLKRLIVPPAWTDRILNIHPALIPESTAAGKGFYGLRVHEAVIASGAVESGATVHVVDNEYDHGPVVLKDRVAIQPSDTPDDLSARVFQLECHLYPRAIAAHMAARPDLFGDPED
jgi:formyltetrahydrofolate-dependent phosphoribosylglycinamide formyltransferase